MKIKFFSKKITLEQSIIYALLFFGTQKRPLSFEELKKCLLLNKVDDCNLNEEISRLQLKKIILAKELEQNHISSVYYCHKDDQNILEIFESRENIRRELSKKAIKFGNYLKFIPFIRQIYIANSLALSTCHENSDIDLFIITKKNRLFICRILVTILISIFNERRHGQKISKKICLSFFIDEQAINLESLTIEDDIYFYYWLIFLQPLIPTSSLAQFSSANKWIKELLPNIKKEFHISPKLKTIDIISYSFKTFLEILLEVTLVSRILNFFCKIHQLNRANNKMKKLDKNSSNIANNHILKFHNSDKRKQFRDLFFERIKES